ncbi:MAG: hypothetical protein J6U10_08695, partial [Lachnospiraceae bacterium]|nr:hypothetical protein [Lachnospiraceae bacterium]
GEDSFECASGKAYVWCTGGRLLDRFFPPAMLCLADVSADEGYADGRGKIVLTVPKEELAARIAEFESIVTGILDDAVGDDYNDFEAAISLYDYICRNWEYDYAEVAGQKYGEEEDPSLNDQVFRCFKERKGICWEISSVYAYLLMQLGMDADGISADSDSDGHEWTALRLGDKWYNADPTWGLSKYGTNMSYYLFNEDERVEDGFYRDSFAVAGWDTGKYANYGIVMNNTVSEFRDSMYFGINREKKTVIIRNLSGDYEAIPYVE